MRKWTETMSRHESNGAVSRRRFLGCAATALTAGGAATLGSSAYSGSEPRPVSRKKKVIVGAHPWVYAATQPGYDITPVLDRIFADMSFAGMDGIELMHTALRPDDSVARIARLSEKHKLPIIGTSFSGKMWNRKRHDAILKDAEIVVSRLAKLGGKTLGTSVGSAPKVKTEEQLDAQAELLRRIIALCESHGVVLNLHNHTYEVENNEHDLNGTLARIPGAKLGPDINWLIRAGVKPIDFIKQHAKRIVFLHLRDQKADGEWSEAMGEGDTDFAAIARVLKGVGFTGHAVIELAHPEGFKLTRPLRESLKISRQYVKKVFGW